MEPYCNCKDLCGKILTPFSPLEGRAERQRALLEKDPTLEAASVGHNSLHDMLRIHIAIVIASWPVYMSEGKARGILLYLSG
jgi:hypothetical protein